MHKLPFSLLLCSIIIFISCNKENSFSQDGPENKTDLEKYSVHFNLSDFTVSYERGMSPKGDDLDYLDYIYYLIYDSTGRLINSVLQKEEESQTFGTFNDYLFPGEYTIVFEGGASPNYASRAYLNPNYRHVPFSDSTQYFSSLKIKNDASGYYDVFSYSNKIKIGHSDTTIQNIKLHRITGQLEVRLLDNPEPTKTTIRGFVYGGPLYYKVNETNNPSLTPVWDSIPPHTGSPLYGFYIGSENKLSVTININKNGVNYSTNVDNVYVYPNKRTVLTGKIDQRTNLMTIADIDTSFVQTIYQEF